MITCPICDYHYSEARRHCPTCGVESFISAITKTMVSFNGLTPVVTAKGYERARQLPQSPRSFQLVN